MVQFSPCKKQDPFSKITRAKRAGDMVQVVERAPTWQAQALSSKDAGCCGLDVK
jgi:hypothetical protein